MATEIELKAWVDDPEKTRALIDSLAQSEGTYEKFDTYWRWSTDDPKNPPLGSGVRVRKEIRRGNTTGIITFKNKEVRDGIEINDEREFEVSDTSVFEELLKRLGLSPWIEKHKTGQSWRAGRITVELSLVEKLGWFVELEILLDQQDSEGVEAARTELVALLDRLGVPRDRLEERYYIEMLKMRLTSSNEATSR
jgi:adenylate cyclase class 2